MEGFKICVHWLLGGIFTDTMTLIAARTPNDKDFKYGFDSSGKGSPILPLKQTKTRTLLFRLLDIYNFVNRISWCTTTSLHWNILTAFIYIIITQSPKKQGQKLMLHYLIKFRFLRRPQNLKFTYQNSNQRRDFVEFWGLLRKL